MISDPQEAGRAGSRVAVDRAIGPTRSELRAWKEMTEAATPGPWQWFGNTKMYEVYLATVDRGRIFVMDFERWGMAGAQPRFQVRLDGEPDTGIMRRLCELEGDVAPKMVASHRKEFVGIGHPDAKFIAGARTAVPVLLAEVERLRALCREACDALDGGGSNADLFAKADAIRARLGDDE
jgi:hypothetical protein